MVYAQQSHAGHHHYMPLPRPTTQQLRPTSTQARALARHAAPGASAGPAPFDLLSCPCCAAPATLAELPWLNSACLVPWTRGGQFWRQDYSGGERPDAQADGPCRAGARGLAGDVHRLSRAGRLRRQESCTRTCTSSDAQVYLRERDIPVAVQPSSGSGRRRRKRKQRLSGPLDKAWSGCNTRKTAYKTGSGTRPIKTPVTRNGCAHPLIVW